MAESEARRHDTVEKTLQQGREGAPPRRVDENQVFGPVDVALGTDKVRFQRLLFGRGRVHVGIEPHLAQDQFATLHARLARAVRAGVEECTAQAVATRMSEDEKAAHGRVPTGSQVLLNGNGSHRDDAPRQQHGVEPRLRWINR